MFFKEFVFRPASEPRNCSESSVETFINFYEDIGTRQVAAEDQAMPTYLVTGELAQQGYDNMEQGPDRLLEVVDMVNSLGGDFDEEDFYVTYGFADFDYAAILDLPNDEVASKVATAYARSGRDGCR